MHITHLPHRGVLEIQGEDRATFLQGLITNDINLVTPEHAIYTAMLSPQGRFLYDFFIIERDGAYRLDVDAGRLADLVKKLSLYKLRSRVTLTPREDLKVFAMWGGDTLLEAFIDPRLKELGSRMIGEADQNASVQNYNLHRIKLGVPEGGLDLIPEKSILLECGLDELNAISWTKGCYIGQELTTRTKFLGLVRKRLLPVTIEGPGSEVGSDIFLDETKVGTMYSHEDSYGLALLRLEYFEGQESPLRCNKAILTPYKPFWMTAV